MMRWAFVTITIIIIRPMLPLRRDPTNLRLAATTVMLRPHLCTAIETQGLSFAACDWRRRPWAGRPGRDCDPRCWPQLAFSSSRWAAPSPWRPGSALSSFLSSPFPERWSSGSCHAPRHCPRHHFRPSGCQSYRFEAIHHWLTSPERRMWRAT